MHAGEPSLHAQWRAAALIQVDSSLTPMHDPFVSHLQGMITPGGLSNEACDAYDAVSCCWYQKMLFCKLVAIYHVCMNEQVVVGVSSRGVHMELLQEVNFRPKDHTGPSSFGLAALRDLVV